MITKIVLYTAILLCNFTNKEYIYPKYSNYVGVNSEWLHTLAKSESSLNPNCINKWGYIGKYQFGKMALRDVGREWVIDSLQMNPYFWNQTDQDMACIELSLLNRKRLEKEIIKYKNKKIKNIIITEGGIIASAHLLGASTVKKWLKNNGNIKDKDGLGTTVNTYMKKFEKVKFSI